MQRESLEKKGKLEKIEEEEKEEKKEDKKIKTISEYCYEIEKQREKQSKQD